MPVLVVFFYAVDVISLLFSALIIYRDFKVHLRIPYAQIVEAFFAHFASFLSVLLVPFLWALNELAKININLSVINVTCLGSQAPLFLLLNLLILGVVIVTIESGVFTYWSTTVMNANRYLLFQVFIQKYFRESLPIGHKFSENEKVSIKHEGMWVSGSIVTLLENRSDSFIHDQTLDVKLKSHGDAAPSEQATAGTARECRYCCVLDDGTNLPAVEEKFIRMSPGWCACFCGPVTLSSGDACEVNVGGRGEWMAGTVDCDYGDNTFDVILEIVDVDGKQKTKKRVLSGLIRKPVHVSSLCHIAGSTLCAQHEQFTVGTFVEVKYDGKGDWLPAKVTAIKENGFYTVDGGVNILGKYIRKPKWFPRLRILYHVLSGGFTDGYACEVRQDDLRWLPAVISVNNGDGTFDVIYEDGDHNRTSSIVKEFIPQELIRTPESHWSFWKFVKMFTYTLFAWILSMVNPMFRTLQYLMGFVQITTFDNQHGEHAYTSTCGSYDEVLAYLSTVASYFLILVAFFIVAQVFIPGIYSLQCVRVPVCVCVYVCVRVYVCACVCVCA